MQVYASVKYLHGGLCVYAFLCAFLCVGVGALASERDTAPPLFPPSSRLSDSVDGTGS